MAVNRIVFSEQDREQAKMDTESRNRTRTALVRAECSHHCAIPASHVIPNVLRFNLQHQNDSMGSSTDQVVSQLLGH